MIIVYHNTNRDFSFNVDSNILSRFDSSTVPKHEVVFPEFANDFEYVAEVDTNLKDVAYLKTNSIANYWGENEGVEEYGKENRSTSVGDVLVTEDGVYAIAMFGFKLLRSF